MMKRIIIISLLLCIVIVLNAELFPGVTGQPLCDSLVKYYKSSPYLGYDAMRDTMYGKIDNIGDYLTCVYTGYSIYMQPGQDPSSWAYAHGIDCEHSWPQSMGADDGTQPGYDMHHMFPTDKDVNNARGNLPFGEIPDALTTKWYWNNSIYTTIPTSNIDAYSELLTSVKFEVREVNCGNTARGMFYFYTMWRSYYLAVDSDTSFFNYQKYDLLDWHRQDPPDQVEIDRTYAIANYQGKVNPFVIDSTLVMRCYFPELLSVEEFRIAGENAIFYDMASNELIVDYRESTNITIFDEAGRAVISMETSGGSRRIPLSTLKYGVYFAHAVNSTSEAVKKLVIFR